MGAQRYQLTIARVVRFSARVAALTCVLVMVSLVSFAAHATVCDPDNTTGDCSDGESCNSNDACFSSTCDTNSTCCSPSDSVNVCGGNCSSTCADGGACTADSDCASSLCINF